MSDASMYRQVLLLAGSQALFQTVSVMVMTIGGLAGAQISAEPQLATAPIAAMFLGTAIATAPASLTMTRFGRRAGFATGALFGVLGGLIGATGIWMGSLWLLSFGTLLVGCYQGFAQFYRFAAAEVASDRFRPKAISLVLAGGVVAAIAGPELGRRGGDLLQPSFLGSFLILAVLSLVAMAVLTGLRIPTPSKVATGGDTGRPLWSIVRQPTYMVALFGAATGYGVMILGMTATPLAMAHHHHDMADTARVIQAHVLGMFLPSFFTGFLIARFGVLRIMAAGIALFAAHIAVASSGTSLYSFGGALVLLGVGWNFLYIGGTTLLTGTYTAAERGRAQAANDLTIFAVSLVSSLLSGGLLQIIGWQMLNLLLVPWICLALLAIIGLGYRRRQAIPA
jgi:predicted MFS family arabinose efflux permease